MKNYNTIYTTGAFIRQHYDLESDTWVWVVKNFDGDTFADGEYINPVWAASSEEGLIVDDGGEEDQRER